MPEELSLLRRAQNNSTVPNGPTTLYFYYDPSCVLCIPAEIEARALARERGWAFVRAQVAPDDDMETPALILPGPPHYHTVGRFCAQALEHLLAEPVRVPDS